MLLVTMLQSPVRVGANHLNHEDDTLA